MRVSAVLALLLGVAGGTGGARADSDDGERSLPLETPAEAWRRPGFRVTLAVPFGELVGLRGAPSSVIVGGVLRAGLRLDAGWSLLASLHYAVAQPSTAAALGGMRFAGTLDPTWHVTRSLALAVGLGFGGIVEGGRERMDPEPAGASLETSYTFPDARTPIGSCSGVGLASLVRGEWSRVLGSRASATVALELVGQWTGCVEDLQRVEPDTGEAIVRRQWWAHVGGTLSVGVTFR
jgi:hypothetical protein